MGRRYFFFGFLPIGRCSVSVLSGCFLMFAFFVHSPVFEIAVDGLHSRFFGRHGSVSLGVERAGIVLRRGRLR